MWQEAVKLGLAGLMVLLDLTGISNANDRILSLASRFDIPDYYEVSESVEPESISIEWEPPDSIPYAVDELNQPVVEATSALVVDVVTGAVLFDQNSHEERAMASTTKLMTARVVLDQTLLSDAVTITPEDTNIMPNVMGLVPGEEITVENLLWGLLIFSSNDAALALARHTGGTVEEFVGLMNEKANEMGLTESHFANPHGLDAPDHYSSAHDLAIIARSLIADPLIADIISHQSATVYSTDGNISHVLETTNELLDSYLPIRGLKTGYTDEAGQTVIELADNGHPIIAIVMNSPDRFQEAKRLIDWAYRNYYWE